MSDDRPDGWSSVPAREPGHVADGADGLEARRTPDRSADAPAPGRVHGRPAPHYGEYAPEGWVNPVLVEQERREQEERSRALRQQAAQDAVRDRRGGPGAVRQGAANGRVDAGPDAPTGRDDGAAGPRPDGRPAPLAARFGRSPIDFVLTVGFLAVGLWTVIQAMSVGRFASAIRLTVERQFTDLADPGALSQAAAVRAVVMAIVFVLVAWWSIRRLRARRRTFWVPLLGGVAGLLSGVVPFLVVVINDPAVAAYLHRMAGS